MNLFANGCSFTHGHKEWGANDAPSEWSWPSVMSSLFDETVNLSWSGGSNERILRTTLEFFDKVKDKTNWIAVIQWTDCYSRHELYDENTDTYFGYISSNEENPVLDYSANRKFITIPVQLNRAVELYHKTHIIRSARTSQTRLMEQQLILGDYFNKNGIKFLFTGMSHSSMVEHDFVHPLVKYLPKEHTILPFSYMINKNLNLRESETDWHPNKAGHAVLANYIINELKARNYL